MSSLPSLGIIGGGFVGSSFAKVFAHYTSVRVFDLDRERATHGLVETLEQDVLLVAVPTPMNVDGSVGVQYVRAALQDIANNSVHWRPVLIKSTLPPQTLLRLAIEYQDALALIFSPEFLTERTAEYDLQQSNRFIFGCEADVQEPGAQPFELVEHLFGERFSKVPRHWTSLEAASLVKYFTNIFFANKVSIFNEFAQIAAAYGQDPAHVISLFLLDSRIGRSHFQVPGHDGQYGFGGSCFLKDINGFIRLAKDVGTDPTVASAAWKKNIEVRGLEQIEAELDRLLGRAASEVISKGDLLALGEDDEA